MNIKQYILIIFSLLCLISSVFIFGVYNINYQNDNVNINTNEIRQKIDYEINKELRELQLNYNMILDDNNEIKNLYKLKLFLINNDISNKKYNKTDYNCVKFTEDLMYDLEKSNFTTGYSSVLPNDVTKFGHRFVWVLIDNKILFIEPQTDEILDIYDIKERYENTIYSVDRIVIYKYKLTPVGFYFDYGLKDNKLDDEYEKYFYIMED